MNKKGALFRSMYMALKKMFKRMSLFLIKTNFNEQFVGYIKDSIISLRNSTKGNAK